MKRQRVLFAAAVIGFLVLFLGALQEHLGRSTSAASTPLERSEPRPTIFENLHSPETSQQADLQIVLDAIESYGQLNRDRAQPIGLNEDLVAALSTSSAYAPALLSKGDPAVVDGRLVDRWGTALHLHALSARHYTVRSAGPDRVLFTGDDLVAGEPSSTH